MIEKLRIFFSAGLQWANQRLYRSAAMSERLMHLFRVQLAVTDQFPGEQQHRDLMAIALSGGGIAVHIDDIDGPCGRRG